MSRLSTIEVLMTEHLSRRVSRRAILDRVRRHGPVVTLVGTAILASRASEIVQAITSNTSGVLIWANNPLDRFRSRPVTIDEPPVQTVLTPVATNVTDTAATRPYRVELPKHTTPQEAQDNRIRNSLPPEFNVFMHSIERAGGNVKVYGTKNGEPIRAVILSETGAKKRSMPTPNPNNIYIYQPWHTNAQTAEFACLVEIIHVSGIQQQWLFNREPLRDIRGAVSSGKTVPVFTSAKDLEGTDSVKIQDGTQLREISLK